MLHHSPVLCKSDLLGGKNLQGCKEGLDTLYLWPLTIAGHTLGRDIGHHQTNINDRQHEGAKSHLKGPTDAPEVTNNSTS